MAQLDRLYGLALRYLAVRGRSRWEMQAYLEKKSDDEALRVAVLERLEDAGLIDDRVFAENWIADRQAVRPRSRRHLAQELAAKRLTKDLIEEALAGIGDDAELQALESVARKKLRLAAYQDRQKLTAYLLRQGYDFAKIKEALERLGVSER